MKVTEIVPNFDAKVREYTNYAERSIKNVCKSFGPRPVGSEAEKKAQEYMLKDLSSFCDEARREEYKVSDKAFMSWVPLGATFILLTILAFTLGWAVIGLALCLLELFFIVGEFIFYKPILDVFFPKKTSGNVCGVIKPRGEVKKRVILSGHTDSAFEWTYTYKGGRPAVLGIIITAVVDLLLGIGGCIYAMIHFGGAFGSVVWSAEGNIGLRIIAVIMYVTVPVMIAALNFCNYRLPVMGANDDLSGVFVSCAAAKFLHDNNIRFENTEVMVICAGGEEAGLRGTKAYAKAHAAELCDPKVETAYFGFDTIRELDFVNIYEKDMTGVVKNDRRVAEIMHKAALDAGIDAHIGTIELGSTDAAAMSQAGVPAASMACMDPSPARYYHTRLDTEDNLDRKALEFGVKTAIGAIFYFDENGLG